MDIISHGLWSSVALGRTSKKSFWLAFAFGIAPDLFSFGIFFIERVIRQGYAFFHFAPSTLTLTIPDYVYRLYDISHSFITFTIAFMLVWYFIGRPIWEMGGWGLHILLDIFTHSYAFFPTPFLWPLSDFKVDGVGWGNPMIFFPNLAFLLVAYVWYFYAKYAKKSNAEGA